jgi:DNA topoisomerase-1
MINKFLDSKFATFMDYQFTAKVEELLDKVANGEYVWWKVVDSVYQVIKPTILELEASRVAEVAASGGKKGGGTRAPYRELGADPTTGAAINIVMTRNGYTLSKMNDATGKYQYANLEVSEIDTITLEDAIKKLSIPRTLGVMDGCEIVLAKAKNIYLKWNGANYSIENYQRANKDADFDSEEITLEEAISVIRFYTSSGGAAGQPSNSVKYGEYEVRNGPFGAYIKYAGANYPLPQKYKKDTSGLSEEICKGIVEKKVSKAASAGDSAPSSARGRGRGRGGSTRGRGRGRGRGK